MGAELSEMCDSICSGVDDTEIEPEIDETTQKYIDFVKRIDGKLKNDKLHVEAYKGNNGKMLYLFYLKSMNIKQMEREIADDDTFNVASSDPFETLNKKWKQSGVRGYTIEDKRKMLEEVWDFILDNTDNTDETKIIPTEQLIEMGERWINNNNLEKNVYLYKFCVTVGPDMNEMEGIKDMDMVERYHNLEDNIDNIEMVRSWCVVL
eukprot:524141_1